MKLFTDLYLIFLVLCVFGCDEGMQIVDPVMPELMGVMGEQKEPTEHILGEPPEVEPEQPPEVMLTGFGKHSVMFVDPSTADFSGHIIDAIKKGADESNEIGAAIGGLIGLIGFGESRGRGIGEGDIGLFDFSYDPTNNEQTGWDTRRNILIGRPTMMYVNLWIYDPKRKCMLENDFTRGDTDFVEPVRVAIFDWNTKEPYRFHSPKWEGEPPEPIVRHFQHVFQNKDRCPRHWFYFVRLPIYLKYVKGDEHLKDSKEFGLYIEDIGITIDFENGEQLTWNLAEVYPEIPPFPRFRWLTEEELESW